MAMPVRIGGLIAKRWPVLGGVLLVAALGGLLWCSLQEPREPVYYGEPILYWLAYNSRTNSRTLEAPKAIAADPSNAVPFLLKELRAQDTPWGRLYLSAWPRLPASIQWHLSQSVSPAVRQSRALYLLSYFGCTDRRALPAVIAVLKRDHDPEVRASAAWALNEFRHNGGVTDVREAATNALHKLREKR